MSLNGWKENEAGNKTGHVVFPRTKHVTGVINSRIIPIFILFTPFRLAIARMEEDDVSLFCLHSIFALDKNQRTRLRLCHDNTLKWPSVDGIPICTAEGNLIYAPGALQLISALRSAVAGEHNKTSTPINSSAGPLTPLYRQHKDLTLLLVLPTV